MVVHTNVCVVGQRCGGLQRVTQYPRFFCRNQAAFAVKLLDQYNNNGRIVGFPSIETIRCRCPRAHKGVVGLGPLLNPFLEENVWMVLCIATAVTHYVEKRTKIGSYLSGPCIAISIGLMGAGMASVLPVASPVYDLISSRLLPLGVAMYVLEVDISTVFSRNASTMLLAFILGAFSTCIGTVCSFFLLSANMGVDAVNVSSALCASYIGGSVNFAAVITALGTNASDTVPTAMSADNLMMGVYLAILMFLSRQSNRTKHADAMAGRAVTAEASPESISWGLALAFVSMTIAQSLAMRMGCPSFGLALISIVACVLAPVVARFLCTNTQVLFAGSTSLASICMTLFFCAMGAQAGSFPLFTGNSRYLFAFIFLQLMIQLSLSLAAARVFRLPLDVMLVACNANVGGAATAVAMCISKKWNHLLQPALLVASVGYIIGNPIGLAMARVLANL